MKNFKKGFAFTLIIFLTIFNKSNYCMSNKGLQLTSSTAIEIKKSKQLSGQEIEFNDILNEHKIKVKRKPNYYNQFSEITKHKISPIKINSTENIKKLEEKNSKSMFEQNKITKIIAHEEKIHKSVYDKSNLEEESEEINDDFFNPYSLDEEIFSEEEDNLSVESDLQEPIEYEDMRKLQLKEEEEEATKARIISDEAFDLTKEQLIIEKNVQQSNYNYEQSQNNSPLKHNNNEFKKMNEHEVSQIIAFSPKHKCKTEIDTLESIKLLKIKNTKNMLRINMLAKIIANDESELEKELEKELEEINYGFFNPFNLEKETFSEEDNLSIESDLPELKVYPDKPKFQFAEEEETPTRTMSDEAFNLIQEQLIIEKNIKQPCNSQNSFSVKNNMQKNKHSIKQSELEKAFNNEFANQKSIKQKPSQEFSTEHLNLVQPSRKRDKAAILMQIEKMQKDEESLLQEELYNLENLTIKQRTYLSKLNITKNEVNFILCNKELLFDLFTTANRGSFLQVLLKIKCAKDLMNLDPDLFCEILREVRNYRK